MFKTPGIHFIPTIHGIHSTHVPSEKLKFLMQTGIMIMKQS